MRVEKLVTVAFCGSLVFAVGSGAWLAVVWHRASHQPSLVCSATSVDLGRVGPLDRFPTHEFILNNETDTTVTIRAVRVECSACLIVECSTKEVRPGKSTALRASLKREGLNGTVVKRVWVYFEGSETPLELSLAADVIGDIG